MKPLTYNSQHIYRWGTSMSVTRLKGLGNIVQMRDSGAKVVTSMLDVQLKIIWKFEWKRIIIHGTNWEKLIWSIP